jgi:hypothetical protein
MNTSSSPSRAAVARRLQQLDARVPKPISPQAHGLIDLLAFPAMLGLTAWLARRNRPAAGLVLLNALGEGTTAAITDFPPGLLPLISFRAHRRVGIYGSPLYLALAAFTPGIPWRYRRFPLLLGLVPLVLNSLSNPAGSETKPPKL